MVTRRRLVIVLGAGLLATSLASIAQQQPGKVYRVGFLFAGSLAQRPQAQGFWQGLQELGYTPGKNVVIEVREAKGKVETLPQLAEELVNWKPDVLVAVTPAAITAAKRATSSIPIVMAITSNPTGFGFVSNLARPEGNVTGPVVYFDPFFSGKRLELLKEMLPNVSRVGILWDAKNKFTTYDPKQLEADSKSLGVQLQSLPFQGPDDLENALTAAMRERPQALYITGDPVTFDKRATIISFSLAQRVPAIHTFPDEVVEGALMAYGVNLRKQYRRVAPYVDKILKGAKPADLPVEQTTSAELAINLKTAKALGIKVPQSMLLRADEVIE